MSDPTYGKTVNIRVSRKKREPKIKIKSEEPVQTPLRFNEKFVEILDELATFMMKKGEPFRARAYQKAGETIILQTHDITAENYSALEKEPGIGKTIIDKFEEFIKTGTLRILERERQDPANVLSNVYGIGPKKAKELVGKGVETIDQLRQNQGLLNDVQKTGLKYYEDILERIPRSEIETYESIFQKTFSEIDPPVGSKFEIVGSYRRGAKSSGDIDVIVTSKTADVFKRFIDRLIESKILIEILSRGTSKCLAIGKLVLHARRIDFLFTSEEEYPFAVLYFTGSKAFNTVMRGRALAQGFSLNEHGMYLSSSSKTTDKKKGDKIVQDFADEKDIFTFLKMEYKKPEERIDGRAVVEHTVEVVKDKNGENGEKEVLQKKLEKPETKTRKIRKTKEEKAQEKLEKEKKKKEKADTKKERSEKTEKNKTVKKTSPKSPKPVSPKLVTELKIIVENHQSEAQKATTKNISIKKPKNKDTNNKTRRAMDPDAINHAIEHFKTEGAHVLDKLTEETLNAIILKALDTYHNATLETQPILSDNEYDVIKEFVERKYPKNTVVNTVGAPVPITKNKVTLPYQMPSMDKIKPDTTVLQSWKAKYPGPYVLSCKLDGVSGMFDTKSGPKPKLYTRGNGSIGQDISHLIPSLRLPNIKGVVVRGEFIIPTATFKTKYADQFANARNLVAGVVNRTSVSPIARDIDFVTYEIIDPPMKPSEQMAQLQALGFKTVRNETLATVTNDLLSKKLVDWRQNYEYEIDGVIVSNDAIYPRSLQNPDHAFAFKMVLSDQMAEAKVVDVLWNASKDGYLKPRVQIEPVHLVGVTIEFATGFNAAFIESNGIGPGAVIQIIRSGDVIPYIKSVVTPATHPLMPSVPYKWNDTHVDILLEDASSDATVLIKNITGFFRGIEVDGLSGGNISRIVEAGFDSVSKILAMTKEDFLTIEGFKEKMAVKLSEGIRAKVVAASLVDIMAASNMFGRGFSDKKVALIMTQYPEILTSVDPDPVKINRLAGIQGMASKTAQAFVEHIPGFLAFLEECGLKDKLRGGAPIQIVANVNIQDPLYQKSIVMSGTRDKELEKILTERGATLSSSVTSKTFVVITPDVESGTGKVATAGKLGVPVMTPGAFRAKYLG